MMDIPQSKWARGSKLLKMATSVAAKELSARLPGKTFDQAKKLALRIEQTKNLVETLSQMKGAAMKAGQLLGLEAGELFPPEVNEILAKLQSTGSTIDVKLIDGILKSKLPAEFYGEISNLSPQPIASASIGQVHTAIFRGKTIAIKVQFPNIAQTIDSDVDMLQSVVDKFRFFTNKKVDLSKIFDEIRETLHQEADYLKEKDFMLQYAENFKEQDGFIVPHPVEELCTKEILAMDLIDAMSMREWAQKATSEDKQLVGEKMMELFLHEYLDCGLVQTDPNWGNFLVTDKNELVILDFGACKTYSDDFRMTYRSILGFSMKRQKAELLEVSEEFGLIDPREPEEVKDSYLHMMDVVIAPFRHDGTFDFANETYSENSKKASIEFAKKLKYSPPPKNLIFLHRKLGGIFQTLKKLEVKMDLRLVWERMV
jgi:aarF domain-containing kinase